ncbi:MAG: D-inositol-3-phosphate glycosyltransferase [Candidatus Argoarchaeum ethanivorans]|uniref:D-inositol-3-phosphate glycosyltransferase n=1 Tax=Candidatus Argoarchaeum ethanivorans TaxID=2608793 RepID=A0A811T3A7_9EURY|nr:MAG: D-inositol-3-phosphate glycosyltransferase [Candidatus Argoarchaeum ethanivorans]
MIKVVYILTQDKGGLLHYTAQLANAISKYAKVTIICPQKIPEHYFSNNVEIVNILDCPIKKNVLKIISFRNIKIVNKIKPDVIHLTIPHPITPLFIFLLRLGKRYPIVFTKHDPKPHVDMYPPEVVADLLHNILINYNKIIVHSEKHKDILVKRGFLAEKIAVIPHGDYSFFANYGKKVPAEENCILFFGHIRKYKGLEYLIKAVPLISKEIPDLKVIIAGDGNFSRYLKLITDKSKFEIYNRFISDELVSELFQRAELVVLPYIEATQSGPLHIACAFKKPVVATNVGAIPEVVKDGKTGFIVPPRDEKALADAIIKLLKDKKLRKEMGENAYEKMKEELSWDKIAEKTIEVYKEAIKDKSCR